MGYTLVYMEEEIPYEIIRSSRKTMALQVTKEGSVMARVPNRMPEAAVIRFVEEHGGWVYGHYKKQSHRQEQQKKFSWQDGALIPVDGRERRICVVLKPYRRTAKVSLEEECLVVELRENNADLLEKAVGSWLRIYARTSLREQVRIRAAAMGITYNSVTVRNQAASTRWGSCSRAGNLNFNWKLILMEKNIQDYVVVHELCHRRQMNHSPLFWAEVEQVIPDYKVLRRRLKDYENKIIPEF